MQLTNAKHIEIDTDPRGVLYLTLSREASQNAFNQAMVAEVADLFDRIATRPDLRVIVVRGKGGAFSAGGDLTELKSAVEMANAPGYQADEPLYAMARSTGALLECIDRCPKIVVSVLEGPVLGTGLGIAAVSDVVLAEQGATLALPEVMLGFSPSQISPFVVRRIGFSATRMLAVTAARINATEAHRLGFADYLAEGRPDLDAQLVRILDAVMACEPGAVASTKALLAGLEKLEIGAYLDTAAWVSVGDMRTEAGRSGLTAFATHSPAPWNQRREN